jgi:thiamine pyrophosphokinase
MFENITRAALIANGEIQDLEWTASQMRQFPFLVAVDGGLNHCRRMQLQPNLLVGDFDSVAPEILDLYASVPTLRSPAFKDETDLELAIEALIQKNVREIAVFGGLGKRMDHTLSNLCLMYRYPQQVRLEAECETLFFLKKAQVISTFPGQVISLIPFQGSATGVCSKGLKWELVGRTLDPRHVSQSNVSEGTCVELTLDTGSVLCCLQRKINT